MRKLLSDPLLLVTRFLLNGFIGLMILGVFACIVVAVALPFLPDEVNGAILESQADLTIAQASWALAGVCGISLCLLALFGVFALLLLRIVTSVNDGDPFIAQNATRLNRMGWLCVGITVLVPFFAVGIERIGVLFGDATDAGGLEFSGNGLIMALLLFILARVFRKGTEMRADLEGTV